MIDDSHRLLSFSVSNRDDAGEEFQKGMNIDIGFVDDIVSFSFLCLILFVLVFLLEEETFLVCPTIVITTYTKQTI